MQYRDSLEEAGGLDRPALEAAVAARREQLLADAERAAASGPSQQAIVPAHVAMD